MIRDDVLATIRANEPRLRELSVREIALFGSFVRGEPTDASDIDFLVEFDEKTFDNTSIQSACLRLSSVGVSILAARAISNLGFGSGSWARQFDHSGGWGWVITLLLNERHHHLLDHPVAVGLSVQS
jgi:predicted nucleotidyltransferase